MLPARIKHKTMRPQVMHSYPDDRQSRGLAHGHLGIRAPVSLAYYHCSRWRPYPLGTSCKIFSFIIGRGAICSKAGMSSSANISFLTHRFHILSSQTRREHLPSVIVPLKGIVSAICCHHSINPISTRGPPGNVGRPSIMVTATVDLPIAFKSRNVGNQVVPIEPQLLGENMDSWSCCVWIRSAISGLHMFLMHAFPTVKDNYTVSR